MRLLPLKIMLRSYTYRRGAYGFCEPVAVTLPATPASIKNFIVSAMYKKMVVVAVTRVNESAESISVAQGSVDRTEDQESGQ